MNPTTPAVPDLPAPDQTALNDAAWKFIDNATGEMSAPLWNTLKVPLWAAISHYIAATQPAPSGDAVEVLREALDKLIDVAEACDSWQSFPRAAINEANAALATTSRAATVAKEGGLEGAILALSVPHSKLIGVGPKSAYRFGYVAARNDAAHLAAKHAATPKPEASAVTPDNVRKGGLYNWKNQPERLVYLGRAGRWHQFAKVQNTNKVWCEVLGTDLDHFEKTEASAANQQAVEARPWEELRAEILHGLDGFTNEQTNDVLRLIDFYTPDAAPISEGTDECATCEGKAGICRFPMCKSEAEQNAITAEIHAQLYGAAPAASNGDALPFHHDPVAVEAYNKGYEAALAARAGTGSAGSVDEAAMRAEFERWCFNDKPESPNFQTHLNKIGDYEWLQTDGAWTAWQYLTTRATKVEAAPGNAGEGEA